MNTDNIFTATATDGRTATGANPTKAVKAARKAGIETSLVVTETATGTVVFTAAADYTGRKIWSAETRSN